MKNRCDICAVEIHSGKWCPTCAKAKRAQLEKLLYVSKYPLTEVHPQ